jgi:GTP-binding protein
VGKSSLINALARRKSLAHVSNTPGRTQTLNLYTTSAGFTLMDLPGYGYAAVPQREKSKWQAMIEGYLLEREGLACLLILVDGEIGPTKLDVQMLDWVRFEGLPHMVVATKADKVKATRRSGREGELAKACRLDRSDIVWVSAAKGTGLDELRRRIDLVLSAANFDD